jgi:DNA (cytosine-5)-methyltransferase 1
MQNVCQSRVESRESRVESMNKLPYKVPSMLEIATLPWNGFKVASTFSGAGGSCTGYRMAGFKVVWANEFVPIAQESYKANAASSCFLDCRDIKNIEPSEILAQTGLSVGDLDLFDGSPPCQAFSTAGKREKGWGKKKQYAHGAKQCNETLFSEYIRLLRGLKPKVFVAENVSGLIKGTAKGYFLEILKELKTSGYQVKCKVLDAQWLGVPQRRQRVIFIGVRTDISLEPVFPKPLPYQYSVRDALSWIDSIVNDPKGQFSVRMNDGTKPNDSITCGNAFHFKVKELPKSRLKKDAYNFLRVDPEQPCGTVTTGSPGNDLGVPHKEGLRKFTIQELKRICSFPDDFILKGSYSQQWERLGNSVPPVMMFHIAKTIRDEILMKVTSHA